MRFFRLIGPLLEQALDDQGYGGAEQHAEQPEQRKTDIGGEEGGERMQSQTVADDVGLDDLPKQHHDAAENEQAGARSDMPTQ